MKAFLKDKKIFLVSVCALFFFILDRVFKYLALQEKILLVKNYNLALSINLHLPDIFILFIYLIIFIFLIYFLIEEFKKINLFFACPVAKLYGVTGFLFLIIGVASNFLDRLKFGFVIDYIDFPAFTKVTAGMHFFYNNLADIYIFIGCVLLLLNIYLYKDK